MADGQRRRLLQRQRLQAQGERGQGWDTCGLTVGVVRGEKNISQSHVDEAVALVRRHQLESKQTIAIIIVTKSNTPLRSD